ncbi:hypothetical protein OG203_43325 [Nocardia sp. NBC_01499]|uniref:hypothetical protein n=1 Tax=Nocardia sp. NBC_01499 TaxID=2903597 RepID=UPI00386F17DA
MTVLNGARMAAVAALIPAVLCYFGPRMYDLVTTPHRLDRAVVSADKYNPALLQIVDHEQGTVAAFAPLGNANAALRSVLVTDAAVAAQLDALIGQIAKDLHGILEHAGTNVATLVVALNTLRAEIDGLRVPADGATTALTGDRTTLAAVLDDARGTAAAVHRARVSADSAADDLSGKRATR